MKGVLIFVFSLLFIACCFPKESKTKTKDFLYGFAGKMNFDKGWTLNSYGWDRDEEGGKIEVLSIGFKIRRDSDVNAARDDLLEAVEQLVAYVNGNEKNRDDFVDFPITEKNLDISLAYVNENDEFIKNNHVAHALLINSKLGYSKKSEKKLDSIHQESYADAVKFVKSKETRKWLKSPTPEDIQKARESCLKIFSDE
ncbi:MAG: hypothetical protein NTX49_01120 [Chlamydiae bacterium]|nr:hypothetical protein [Chlamydiota bacterium]